MKKKLFCLLVFGLFFCGTKLSAQDVCNSNLHAGEAANAQKLISFTEHNTAEYAYDVTYYRNHWEVNPDTFFIKGSVTTYFKPTVTGMNQLGFDMNPNLNVDSVLYHKVKISDSKNASASELLINLPKTIPIGIIDSVTVYYQGAPNNNQGSITLGFHNNIPDIWTLSEPYGARDWWPCKQSLTDKADSVDIYIKTPYGNLAASNGLLVDSSVAGSDITFHWKHRYPIATYLIGIAVTQYSQYNLYAHVGPKPGDSLLILNYVYPEDSANFYAPSLLARNTMELYVKLFGRYPFDKEKYGQAEFDYGGGMEHQTMSFVRDMEFSLISHEMAHHWFGDKVTCGSWKDIWLNEGFAVFCEGQAEKNIMGSLAWDNWIKTNLGTALQQESGSVYVDDSTSVNRIFSNGLTYCKAAYVLRMLEFIMGDSAFYQGCRDYLNDTSLAYSFANTIDLQNHFEATSGLDLSNFFKEWIYGQGYPLFSIYWSQTYNELSIKLVQKQTNASVPFFHIPVPITIRQGGKDSTFNLVPSSATQNFVIPIHDAVDSLIPDPEQWLLASYSVFATDSLPGNPVGIYPNPVSTKLTINMHLSNPGSVGEILIYDMKGRLLYSKSGIQSNLIKIDVSKLANGFYILKYVSNTSIGQEKFFKL